MPSKLQKAIAAVKDQTSISLAKVSTNTCSTLEVAVLKATTHDDVPVDERYIHEVVQLVSSNKAYAAACARAIGKRIGRTRNWIVALKSLMLVLRIFQDGDPYFPREVLHAMKRGAKILNLSNFRDDSNSSPWDFTAFIRTFALYLDERLDCFLTGKLQRRCNYNEGENSNYLRGSSDSSRSRRGRTNEAIREMKPPMLLDKISYWQRLLERAIATKPTGAAQTNYLVQSALYAVAQESFDLYKDISDGLAIVLDSFFQLPYQTCVTAFQTCVKSKKQFEEIASFYSLCKYIGVGRTSEYPSVQTITEELIESLQEFLKDQSSFPVKSLGELLPQGPGSMKSSRSRFDSYGGQSEFSLASTETNSDRSPTVSGNGSPSSSLEDLIRATATGKTPSISIDLEAYSDTQFNEDMCDTGTARSLPVSMTDLVALSEDNGNDDDENQESQDQKQQPVAEKAKELNSKKAKQEQIKEEQNPTLDSSSSKEWEVVLIEALTSSSTSFNAFPDQHEPSEESRNDTNVSPVKASSSNGWDLALFETTPQTKSVQPMPNTAANNINSYDTSTLPSPLPLPLPSFNAFQENQELEQASRNGANSGWDMVLFETSSQTTTSQPMPTTSNNVNNFNFSYLNELYSQNSLMSSQISGLKPNYNPFLQDTSIEQPAVPNMDTNTAASMFSSTHLPTFQATPTFSTENSFSEVQSDLNSDPFGTFPSNDQMLNGAVNKKDFLDEQQLWLQNQNKIIAKHMS